MTTTDGILAKLLVAYYGLLEAAHIVTLALAGLQFIRAGTLGFPVPPPPAGWTKQLYPFFIAMGAVDAVNVFIAWLFVYGYFTRSRWRWWVGGITLALVVYSAIVFAWGTIRNGAWSHQPTGYLTMAVLFVPVAALALLYVAWGLKGQFWDDGRG